MASRKKHKRRLMADINVVPYIDVTLVLLIIFMITAPLLQQGVEVDLPEASAEPVSDQEIQDPLILTVDKAGRYYLNIGNKDNNHPQALDHDALLKKAATVIQHRKDLAIMVKGDGSAPYEDVVKGMTLLQQAGATNIGLLTDPLE